jgi:hypothetical protein
MNDAAACSQYNTIRGSGQDPARRRSAQRNPGTPGSRGCLAVASDDSEATYQKANGGLDDLLKRWPPGIWTGHRFTEPTVSQVSQQIAGGHPHIPELEYPLTPVRGASTELSAVPCGCVEQLFHPLRARSSRDLAPMFGTTKATRWGAPLMRCGVVGRLSHRRRAARERLIRRR